MRNRAKCKLCNQVIESREKHDYVTCPCGEISIDGGPGSFRCIAKDFNNFLRIDEEGNEIVVKLVNKEDVGKEIKEPVQEPEVPISKEDSLVLFNNLIQDIESMPDQALRTPVSHQDLLSLMLLLKSIFSAE